MTRILGGSGKGRRLKTPGGGATRPTGARVRRSFFDALAARIPGCRFLDPFAGSGAVGVEALSRGAGRVVLVDESRAAVAAIRSNLALLGAAAARALVWRREARAALEALAAAGESFDVVYLDPPYASTLYEPLLEALDARGLVAAGGVVAAEHFHKTPLPATIGALVRTRELRAGEHRLTIYNRRAD